MLRLKAQKSQHPDNRLQGHIWHFDASRHLVYIHIEFGFGNRLFHDRDRGGPSAWPMTQKAGEIPPCQLQTMALCAERTGSNAAICRS